MTLTGGCYCGEVRFEATGPVHMKGLCLCRTCQINSGGMGNLFAGLMDEDFRYTKGAPARFAHPDKPDATIREFWWTRAQLAARRPKAPAGVICQDRRPGRPGRPRRARYCGVDGRSPALSLHPSQRARLSALSRALRPGDIDGCNKPIGPVCPRTVPRVA